MQIQGELPNSWWSWSQRRTCLRKQKAKHAICMLLKSVCLSHPGGSASSSGLAPPGLAWLWRCPHDPYHCRVETLWICPPASDVCCASALSTLCLQPSTATAGLQTENSNRLILCCCFQVASTWQEPTPMKADIDQFSHPRWHHGCELHQLHFLLPSWRAKSSSSPLPPGQILPRYCRKYTVTC